MTAKKMTPKERKRQAPSEPGAHALAKAQARAQVGSRNDTGFWLACLLRDSGLDKDTARLYLLEYARTVPHTEGNEYTESEALASLEAAYNNPQRRIGQ